MRDANFTVGIVLENREGKNALIGRLSGTSNNLPSSHRQHSDPPRENQFEVAHIAPWHRSRLLPEKIQRAGNRSGGGCAKK